MYTHANLSPPPKHSVCNGLMATCMAVSALGFALPAQAGHYIVNFDAATYASTRVTGINDSGAVAGYSVQFVPGDLSFGFARAADGTITTFAPSDGHATFAESIDADGKIAGYYTDNSTGLERGFVRGSGSAAAIETFDALYPPGQLHPVSTYAWSISNGEIAGSYTIDRGAYHGFLRRTDGTVDRFDPQGSVSTYAVSINNGAVTGYYFDGSNNHCFLRATNGAIVTFDPPMSLDAQCFAINSKGWITGSYRHVDDPSMVGFVRSPGGTFTFFDRKFGQDDTFASGINDRTATTGSWYDRKGEAHGFARSTRGKLESFDPYNSIGTFPVGINAKGSIAGYWKDGSGQTHGFIRIPGKTPQ